GELAREFETARHCWEAERRDLLDQVERRDRAAESLHQNGDDAQQEAEDRVREATSRLSARIRQIEAAGVAAEQRHGLDLERLDRALEQAREQAADATRRHDELASKFRDLEDKIEEERALARDRLESERQSRRMRETLQASLDKLVLQNK